MQEYREQIFMLLKDYDNTKMNRWEKGCSFALLTFFCSVYLHDLVESTHEFLKLLEEHTKKLKHVFVQRRRAARKSSTKKKKNKTKSKKTPG